MPINWDDGSIHDERNRLRERITELETLVEKCTEVIRQQTGLVAAFNETLVPAPSPESWWALKTVNDRIQKYVSTHGAPFPTNSSSY